MMSRIRNLFYTASALALVERLPTENANHSSPDPFTIPAHQREYCWTDKKQKRFIRSVLYGLPVPSILTRKHRNGTITLEDGRQRLTTLQLFFADKITDDRGLKYSEFTPEERSAMEHYQFSVTQYSGATDEDAIYIFDDHQNGVPLSVGERLHGLSSLCPIIQFTKQTLLTPGQGLHDRAALVWGVRGFKDRRRNHLTQMYALCAGLTFGPQYMTKKWNEIKDGPDREHDSKLTTEFDTTETTQKLEAILSILEQAQAQERLGAKLLKKQFDPGYLTGYIAYSFFTFPDEIGRLSTRWVDFIVDARRHPEKIKTVLQVDLSGARQWEILRWKLGYLRVFEPNHPLCVELDTRRQIVESSDEETDSD